MPITRSQATKETPTNTPKRTLSPETTPISSTRQKKSKTNKMPSDEFSELKNMFTSLSSSISMKFDESKAAMESGFTNFNSKFTELATQINADVQAIKSTVTEFQNKIVSDIENMNATLKNHADRIDNNEDDIQRVQLSQDVRLVGFAVKENEDLAAIFNKIADNIGFAIGSNGILPSIERMPTKNHATGQIIPSPVIVIHFNSLRQKQIFYSLYLNKMPLNPENFGLTSDNRIVIGEHLTRKNAQLFRNAQLLRKDGKIAQTFTENGIIKIRFTKGKNQSTYTIRNQIELDTIVAQNELAKSHTQSSNGTANAPMDVPTISTHSINSTNPTPMNGNVQHVNQDNAQIALNWMQQQQMQQQQIQQQQHITGMANTNTMGNVTQQHQWITKPKQHSDMSSYEDCSLILSLHLQFTPLSNHVGHISIFFLALTSKSI